MARRSLGMTKLSKRMKPLPYFIEYADPAWEGEPGYDHCITLDAASIEQARVLAKQRGDAFNTHVGIYRRFDFEQIEPPWGPWTYDSEWVEDGA